MKKIGIMLLSLLFVMTGCKEEEMEKQYVARLKDGGVIAQSDAGFYWLDGTARLYTAFNMIAYNPSPKPRNEAVELFSGIRDYTISMVRPTYMDQRNVLLAMMISYKNKYPVPTIENPEPNYTRLMEELRHIYDTIAPENTRVTYELSPSETSRTVAASATFLVKEHSLE